MRWKIQILMTLLLWIVALAVVSWPGQWAALAAWIFFSVLASICVGCISAVRKMEKGYESSPWSHAHLALIAISGLMIGQSLYRTSWGPEIYLTSDRSTADGKWIFVMPFTEIREVDRYRYVKILSIATTQDGKQVIALAGAHFRIELPAPEAVVRELADSKATESELAAELEKVVEQQLQQAARTHTSEELLARKGMVFQEWKPPTLLMMSSGLQWSGQIYMLEIRVVSSSPDE